MMENRKMAVFYAAMVGIPVLMLLILVLSYFSVFGAVKYALGILLGLACIAYGVLGFREVFMHG